MKVHHHKLLALISSVLSSSLIFSHVALDPMSLVELPTMDINDSLLGKDWGDISHEHLYIQDGLQQLHEDSLLKLDKSRCMSLFLRRYSLDLLTYYLPTYRIEQNSWSIYDLSTGQFTKKSPQQIKEIVTGKRIGVMVHGCDSRKEDMVDLTKIIDQSKKDMYDYFVFFEYDSKLGLEPLAVTYSKGLYEIIKNDDKIRLSIFAHSMGGLIVRSALRMTVDKTLTFSQSLMDKIVNNQKDLCLVTFGTPHGGVPSFFDSSILKNYTVNGLCNGAMFLCHPSVQDMMTNDVSNPTLRSNFLSKLNNSKKWKHSNNLHLFTVAGNASESYQSYGMFKMYNYKNYPNAFYDGLVTIDSAFHNQLDNESKSWKKDLTHRIVIPANHYNMKGSKSLLATPELPAATSLRVNAYHIIDAENKNVLDQELVMGISQQELNTIYDLFQTKNINENKIPNNILIKYNYLKEKKYSVAKTTEEDMDQIITQVLTPWLDEIEKRISYKSTGQEIKEQLEKTVAGLKAKFAKKENIKKLNPNLETPKTKGIFNKVKSFLGF